MPINVTCNSCGAAFRTKDSAAGKTSKCPKCGNPITIPHASEDDDVFDAEEVLEDYDAEEDGLDFGSFNPSAGKAVRGDDRKPCPACGEMIVRKAAKCRFCGEIFDPALKKRARKAQGGYADIDEDMTTGDWIVAVICSGIGCIAGLVWMIQGKPKGVKMLGISFLFCLLWSAVRVVIEQAAKQ